MEPDNKNKKTDIDRIREIVFGHQMQEYDHKFEKFNSVIESITSHFEKKLEILEQNFTQKSQDLVFKLENSLNTMEQKAQALQLRLEDLNANQQKFSQKSTEGLNQKFNEISARLDKEKKDLLMDFKNQAGELKSHITGNIESLKSQSILKKQLSELFLKFGKTIEDKVED